MPDGMRDEARHLQSVRAAARAWLDPESFATTLVVLAVDQLGIESFGWDPATIRIEAEEVAGAPLPEANFSRLLAGIKLLTTDEFFQDVAAFVQLANILSGDVLDPLLWDPADAVECAWAVTEALVLADPGEDEPFSDEVRHYIGAALDAEGIVDPPDVLRLAMRDGTRATGPLPPGAREAQDAKSREITDIVRENIQRLVEQLESLDLENGSTAELTAKLRKNLGAARPR